MAASTVTVAGKLIHGKSFILIILKQNVNKRPTLWM